MRETKVNRQGSSCNGLLFGFGYHSKREVSIEASYQIRCKAGKAECERQVGVGREREKDILVSKSRAWQNTD